MSNSRGRVRNRDVGLAGHPTRFAPKSKPEPAVGSLVLPRNTSTALTDLKALKKSVTGEAHAALLKQIEYAKQSPQHAEDALRFRQHHTQSQDFTVEGRSFTVHNNGEETRLSFTTRIDAVNPPELSGITIEAEQDYQTRAVEAIQVTGVHIESHDSDQTTLSTITRPVEVNSLPDCANQILDSELNVFVAVDNFRTRWNQEHTQLCDNWLDGETVEYVR